MTIIEMLEVPEKYIPDGDYCYFYNNGEYDPCPFWELKPETELPHQENGYCHFLHTSDWELNEENNKNMTISYAKDKSIIGVSIADLYDDEEIDPKSGKKTHFPSALLWDQCKECGINMEYEDEDNFIMFDNSPDQN